MAKKSGKNAAATLDVDRDWQARSDASTLRQAAEVMGDDARMKQARAVMMREQRGMKRMMGDNSLGLARGKK